MYQIHNGDCAEVMASMEDNSVDAIVTDPPYGLSFMNKEWDSFGTDTRQPGDEHYTRVDNPYGRGKVRYGYGSKLRDSMEMFQLAMTPIFEEALRVAKPGAHLLCFGGTRTFHRMACAIEDAGWEIRDCIMWVYGSGFPHGMDVGKKLPEWTGWNTALKPAWEPIIVARKPLDGTVANNVLTWGVGALNIDGCRVPTDDNLDGGTYGGTKRDRRNAVYGKSSNGIGQYVQPVGRFPANLIHDGSQMVLDLFPESKGQQGDLTGNEPSKPAKNTYGEYDRHSFAKRNDSGSAARFFYCAKASKKERGEGNHHPTIKPIALMRWLVTLVTPEGG